LSDYIILDDPHLIVTCLLSSQVIRASRSHRRKLLTTMCLLKKWLLHERFSCWAIVTWKQAIINNFSPVGGHVPLVHLMSHVPLHSPENKYG
jgi:hypothetical protein